MYMKAGRPLTFIFIDFSLYFILQEVQKSKMKSMDGGGAFMNKGKTGNWKNHFTPELEKRFEEWEAKELKGSDLKFEYVI